MMNDRELNDWLESHFREMEKELYEQEITSKSPDKRRPNLRAVKTETPRSD